ncbi:hypothetical protein PoB_004045300 [Plakobranchus ocellatus]|uniref:Uncharacterized protein n=1 Tax=Plakobranchus ocellatus TaxID=259542 RepID=A0AAV4B5B1_9GAST|nr:hypothetical protein PoB_004045300 [Plakobranchus ocellatus]
MDMVQGADLQLVLGVFRSTPIAFLELASGCEPLSLMRDKINIALYGADDSTSDDDTIDVAIGYETS